MFGYFAADLRLEADVEFTVYLNWISSQRDFSVTRIVPQL
jgi:hypothetical protein